MSFQITLSSDKPSIENTESFEQHRASTPSSFSLNEKEVLYGGGHYLVSVSLPQLNVLLLREGPADAQNVSLPCWVYVLERRVFIWFQTENIGVAVPYQCIILHGLNENELYIQFCRSVNEDVTFEFQFSKAKVVDIAQIEPIFGNIDTGLRETYRSICERANCNYEPNLEEEVQPEDGFGEYCEVNGEADDLDEFCGTVGSGRAAVSVEIERKKSRKVEYTEEQKRRRMQ